MTESKFRERRSAFREEAVDEQAEPAAEPSRAEPARAEPSPPGPSPVESESQAQSAEPSGPDEPAPGAGEAALEEEAGMGPGMDLDRLAEMDVPEPSFLELIEPHVEMALRFLGELPLTPDGERRVLPRWARREIDLLGLLEERTRGNLPVDEERYLAQALDQLRMLYLKVSR